MDTYLLTGDDLLELIDRIEKNLKKYWSYPAMESVKQTTLSFIKKRKL